MAIINRGASHTRNIDFDSIYKNIIIEGKIHGEGIHLLAIISHSRQNYHKGESIESGSPEKRGRQQSYFLNLTLAALGSVIAGI